MAVAPGIPAAWPNLDRRRQVAALHFQPREYAQNRQARTSRRNQTSFSLRGHHVRPVNTLHHLHESLGGRLQL
jgi:hypothetical protein